MKRSCLLLACGSMLCFGSAALADSRADEAAVIGIEQDMAAAQTAAAFTASWDDHVAWYDVGPGQVDGLAAARANLTNQFARFASLKQTIVRLKVKVEGNMAFAYSLQHFVGFEAVTHKRVEATFRQTDCFMKKAGRWKLVHQHASYPVDKNLMAILTDK